MNAHDAWSYRALKALKSLCVAHLALLSCLASAEDYELKTLADGLRWPWSVAELPEGGFLITQREGQLVHINEDGEKQTVGNTPETLFAGQGGYFDIVLHPDYATNKRVYLSYAEGIESANGTAIYSGRFEDGAIVDGKKIFRVAPDKTTPQHYGARMLFLPDDSLLITTGDGFEHREDAQDPENQLGKVIRISEDGEALGTGDSRFGHDSPVYTYGHRNPQGLALDSRRGVVYLHEHGPRGGDEVNVLTAGNNYGWPAVTRGVDYSGAYVSPFQQAPGMEDGIWVWTPSIAPSGMAWYEGSRFSDWSGSLLVGALVDEEVRRLRVMDGVVTEEETLFSELGTRIRDVRVFDGRIYLLTDAEQGQLIEVLPR